jgi:uncharacterized protein (TIGR03067 family)
MTHHPKVLLAAVFAAAGFSLTLAAQEAPKSQLPEQKVPPKGEKAPTSPLEGVYTITSGERDGKPIPEERIKGSVVAFAGDKIVATDKDKKEFFAATYALDTASKPWVIKMKSTTPKDGEAIGLVKKEDDTVTLVYALPGGAPPKEFKAGDKQHLFVLENMNTTKK